MICIYLIVDCFKVQSNGSLFSELLIFDNRHDAMVYIISPECNFIGSARTHNMRYNSELDDSKLYKYNKLSLLSIFTEMSIQCMSSKIQTKYMYVQKSFDV